jgi:ribosomal protein L37E
MRFLKLLQKWFAWPRCIGCGREVDHVDTIQCKDCGFLSFPTR